MEQGDIFRKEEEEEEERERERKKSEGNEIEKG